MNKPIIMTLSAISALGARDYAISLDGDLEPGETISDLTVTSQIPSLLEIVGTPVANADPISQDNIQVAVGRAATFSVKGLKAGNAVDVIIHVDFVGTTGSADGFDVLQPFESRL